MPTFDFKEISVGKYKNTNGVISYETPMSFGEAQNCTLNVNYAEGRAYAKGALRRYKKLPIGGTLSVATLYIPENAQEMMFGKANKTRSVGDSEVTSSGLKSSSIASYVGVGAIAPDETDEGDKFTACFVPKALFGAPGFVYQTKNESLVFQTPTTTGEFMPSDDDDFLFEDHTFDTLEAAQAWIAACFGAASTEGGS